MTPISRSSHISVILLNWSFIRAIKGEIYKIFSLFLISVDWEMAGKKAASVFPDAVGAAKIKLLSEPYRCLITASWIFVSDGQPFS